MRFLEKAHIKFVACAIYTIYFTCFFLITYTLLFDCKRKSYDHCFRQQIRPQTTVQLCILQDYSSVKIGFSMNYTCHRLPTLYNMLFKYVKFRSLQFYSELNELYDIGKRIGGKDKRMGGFYGKMVNSLFLKSKWLSNPKSL